MTGAILIYFVIFAMAFEAWRFDTLAPPPVRAGEFIPVDRRIVRMVMRQL